MCFPISPITSREKVCWCAVFESLGFKWLAKVVTWKEKRIFFLVFINFSCRYKDVSDFKARQDYCEALARTCENWILVFLSKQNHSSDWEARVVKGWLISKFILVVIVLSQKTNEIFSRISALASKK